MKICPNPTSLIYQFNLSANILLSYIIQEVCKWASYVSRAKVKSLTTKILTGRSIEGEDEKIPVQVQVIKVNL